MMNIKLAERQYLNDPEFASMVDYMMQFLRELRITPHELRGMATYAAVRFEQTRPYPEAYVIPKGDIPIDSQEAKFRRAIEKNIHESNLGEPIDKIE